MAFERVYCVNNFHDGPREGLADYEGMPHRYVFQWDEANDDYANRFTLAPVDADTMQLALEQWNFWRQWEFAFKRGEVSHSSHPGFASIDAQHNRRKSSLASRYEKLVRLPGSYIANFHTERDAVDPETGWMISTVVEWTMVD